jgi:hypothetical protein
MATVYQLTRQSLNNVPDVAGLWQHEAGVVMLKNKQVGQYISYKRVTHPGSDPQNTASVTMTIFLERSKTGAPENITAQGSHDFNSGNETGSVSAASANYAALIGKHFDRTVNTVTIG